MKLRNCGEDVVMPLQPCLDLHTDEENSNSLSNIRDNLTETTTTANNNHIYNTNRERICSVSSHESLGQSSSSIDIFPQGDEYQCFSHEEATDSDFSDDGNCGKDEDLPPGGITNPNYPGFSSLPDSNGNDDETKESGQLNKFDTETISNIFSDININKHLNSFCSENTNTSCTDNESLNHLDSGHHFQKDFYNKPKFENRTKIIQDLNIVGGELNDAGQDNIFPEINFVISSTDHKFEFSPKESYQDSGVCSTVSTDGELDSFEASFLVQTTLFPVSGVFETTVLPEDDSDVTSSPEEERNKYPLKELESLEVKECDTMEVDTEVRKLAKDSENEKKMVEGEVEKKKRDVTWATHGRTGPPNKGLALGRQICRKGEGAQVDAAFRRGGASKMRAYHTTHRSSLGEKKPLTDIGIFDVYNIETAMPTFDLDAIESHLKAASEEEERRRNDREEIRRRLAMGPDNDELYCDRTERVGRKPSLQSRLQSGMNLQICFMNDTGSDSESPSMDESTPPPPDLQRPASLPIKNNESERYVGQRPSTACLTLPLKKDQDLKTEADLFACQARLQFEARQALMQAKEMARMQMEVEKQRMPLSPITQMVRTSLLKVGVPFPEERRRLSRQILTEMNVAQLQVIINDLHTQVEVLNENLVEYLMSRDDLHMEQDSMLVDIEDLTRYIGAKEKTPASNGNDKNGCGVEHVLQRAA